MPLLPWAVFPRHSLLRWRLRAGGFLGRGLGSRSSVEVREAGLSRGKIGTDAGVTKASVGLRANTRVGLVFLRCPKLSKNTPLTSPSSHCSRQSLCLGTLPERDRAVSSQQLAFPTAGGMSTPVLKEDSRSKSTATLSGSRPKITELRATTGF